MVRIHDTRKKQAKELIARLERGPSFAFVEFGALYEGCDFVADLTPEQRQAIQTQFEDRIRIWNETWNIPVIKELLKDLLK